MNELSYKQFELYYRIKPYVDNIDKRKLQLDLAYATKHPDRIDIDNSKDTVTLKAYLLNGLEIELVSYTREDIGEYAEKLENNEVHEFKNYMYSRGPITKELTESISFYANWVIPTFSSTVIHYGTLTIKGNVDEGENYHSILHKYLGKPVVN